jgi:copper chaperone CopZ
MTSLTLSISGMHCDHCVTKVKNALEGVDGVFGASVDRGAATAEVDLDPARASADDLVAAVEQVGYGATVSE